MFSFLRGHLSEDQIHAIVDKVQRLPEAEHDKAWKLAAPLLRAQSQQVAAALALLFLVRCERFARDRALQALASVFESHPQNPGLVAAAATAYEMAHDRESINAAPPEHPLPHALLERLRELLQNADAANETDLLQGLSTLARLLGRRWDALAEQTHRRLIELDPENWRLYFDFGLLLKTRGRFAEGVELNQRASDLGGAHDYSVGWNLGICATGANLGPLALGIWRAQGNKLELGRFDLPDGSYPLCKVRLAQRPIAERTAATEQDDPGLEETVWLERLSPCHGIVRSVLWQRLGVDFGDVVLFDGAPITDHRYGDDMVPVFPHLTTLVRAGYQRYEFAATQREAEQVDDLSNKLPDDGIIYVHSERVLMLCKTCWRDAALDRGNHAPEPQRVVFGAIAVSGTHGPQATLAAVDAALAAAPDVELFAPSLCSAAGDVARAAVEQRRFDMLQIDPDSDGPGPA